MMLPLYTIWYDDHKNDSWVLVRADTTDDCRRMVYLLQRNGITNIEVCLTASMTDITKEFIK